MAQSRNLRRCTVVQRDRSDCRGDAPVVEAALEPLRCPPRGFGDVLEWACPVPYFGRVERARVASVGLNPSSLEFCDQDSTPLRGAGRRLETLESLRLRDWGEAGPEHCSAVAEACSGYFDGNPYWRWFEKLEEIFEAAGRGTFNDGGACHIDLVPWATRNKWSRLTSGDRSALLRHGSRGLAALLTEADLEVLVINGKGVVEGLEAAVGIEMQARRAREWDDQGRAARRWKASLTRLGRIELGRATTVVGWNWNLQSSHVSAETRQSITQWAARAVAEAAAPPR